MENSSRDAFVESLISQWGVNERNGSATSDWTREIKRARSCRTDDIWAAGHWSRGHSDDPQTLYIWSGSCLICEASLPKGSLCTPPPHIGPRTPRAARILTASTSASRLHHRLTYTQGLILSEWGASEHVRGDQGANWEDVRLARGDFSHFRYRLEQLATALTLRLHPPRPKRDFRSYF